MADNKKRKKAESRILGIMTKLDNTGNNTEMYTKLFRSMNDSQFHTFMKALRDGVTQLFAIMPNMKSGMKMNDIVALAENEGINLFQRLWLTDQSSGRKYLTNEKYMVTDLPVRRVKQYLFGKLSLPESDSRINALTGQVIPPDKGAAISSIEVQILANKGLDKSLLELVKVRGGDLKAWNSFKHQLEEEGRSTLAETPLENKPRSVVIAGVYLHGMMLEHNLSD